MPGKAYKTDVLAPFLPLSVRGISMNDGSISFGSEKHRIVIGYITNACSIGDFVVAAIKGDGDFRAPNTGVTQMAIADAIVACCNNSVWRDISTAPKTRDDFVGGAIEVLAWCPDPEARDGGERRVVWWEPGINGGCWFCEGNYPVEPTLWLPMPDIPALISGDKVV